MTQVLVDTQAELPVLRGGRWVSEREFSKHSGLSENTLSNWRYRDRQAGREGAAPGFPRYRKFGTAVRYWIDDAQ